VWVALWAPRESARPDRPPTPSVDGPRIPNAGEDMACSEVGPWKKGHRPETGPRFHGPTHA